MSEAAITALETEIAETEQAQEPAREQIATLQAQLTAGDETIARNRAAIALLRGETPLTPAAGGSRRPTRPRAASTSASPSLVSRDRVIDFLGANGRSKAQDITAALGIGGPALTKELGAMAEEGLIVKEGERRGTTYTLKVG